MDEPRDPHAGKTYTLTMVDPETGDQHKTEMSAEQVLDLGTGHAVTGWVHDEEMLMDDDGTLVHCESIAPVRPKS